jgi:hypothetical protein
VSILKIEKFVQIRLIGQKAVDAPIAPYWGAVSTGRGAPPAIETISAWAIKDGRANR